MSGTIMAMVDAEWDWPECPAMSPTQNPTYNDLI